MKKLIILIPAIILILPLVMGGVQVTEVHTQTPLLSLANIFYANDTWTPHVYVKLNNTASYDYVENVEAYFIPKSTAQSWGMLSGWCDVTGFFCTEPIRACGSVNPQPIDGILYTAQAVKITLKAGRSYELDLTPAPSKQLPTGDYVAVAGVYRYCYDDLLAPPDLKGVYINNAGERGKNVAFRTYEFKVLSGVDPGFTFGNGTSDGNNRSSDVNNGLLVGSIPYITRDVLKVATGTTLRYSMCYETADCAKPQNNYTVECVSKSSDADVNKAFIVIQNDASVGSAIWSSIKKLWEAPQSGICIATPPGGEYCKYFTWAPNLFNMGSCNSGVLIAIISAFALMILLKGGK